MNTRLLLVLVCTFFHWQQSQAQTSLPILQPLDLTITPVRFESTNPNSTPATAIADGAKIHSFSASLTGNAGTWVQVFLHVYLDPDLFAVGSSERADVNAWLGTYPFLAKKEISYSNTPSSGFAYGVLGQNQPSFFQDRGLVESHLSRATATSDPNAVSAYFQYLNGGAPTLPSGGGQPISQSASLNWSISPGYWGGTLQESDWRKRLVWEPDASVPGSVLGREFSVRKCAQFAMRKQAGDRSDADAAYNSNAVSQMMEMGALQLSIQAVALVDVLAVDSPVLNDLPPEGLPDLPNLPKVKISLPRVIPVITAPAGVRGSTQNSTAGPQAVRLHKATVGKYIVLPIEGLVPPFNVDVVWGANIYTLAGEVAPRLGHARFPMPTAISASSLPTNPKLTIQTILATSPAYAPNPPLTTFDLFIQ